jgi:hypothetical protein
VAGNAKGLTASVIKAAAQASNGWAGYRALQLRYSYLQPRPGVTVPEQAAVRFGWVTDETIDYVQSDPGLSLQAHTPSLRGASSRTDRSLPEGYQHPGIVAGWRRWPQCEHRFIRPPRGLARVADRVSARRRGQVVEA